MNTWPWQHRHSHTAVTRSFHTLATYDHSHHLTHIHINNHYLTFTAEMCNCPGQDVAPEALLLHTMRKYFRRRRLPRTRRKALLSGGLLQHVRPQMCWMQFANSRELHLCPQRPVAPRMFRLQGEYSSPPRPLLTNFASKNSNG